MMQNSISLCITCNKQLRDEITESMFSNLLILLSAFLLLAVIIVILNSVALKHYNFMMENYPRTANLNPVPLFTASIVLGMGIGGFIDGIVMHQILQWHGMLSNIIPPDTVNSKSLNMFWDGIFHVFTLTMVIIGILLLKNLIRRNISGSSRVLTGGILAGWGIFNLVEGTINHHILKIHNVREVQDPDPWNFGFLVISAFMVIIGLLIARDRQAKT